MMKIRLACKAFVPSEILPRIPGARMTPRELTRALRAALASEQEAVILYQAIADATDEDTARAVLESIANEERVHTGELQRLIEMLDAYELELMAEGAEEADAIAEANQAKREEKKP